MSMNMPIWLYVYKYKGITRHCDFHSITEHSPAIGHLVHMPTWLYVCIYKNIIGDCDQSIPNPEHSSPFVVLRSVP